ncbi:T9SS type A sorting domain-containing protein [candidate division WOR-3 bacterium]|uniref:T9SS type A sorting domain-containing protein n=1 Tax=candidate division WOR-3 bacterium TaxID=2052148 RepID=A0A938BQB5_UNCW3|nr:T9SS type A sorting domain-containing protein [candidate division WOR-3 bacterium]
MRYRYRNGVGTPERRPAAQLKFAAAVIVVLCIAGPAMGKAWNAATRRIITPPTGSTDSGTMVVPSAVVFNPGDSTASFPVHFYIGTFYADTQYVSSLAKNDSATVVFDTWPALQRGSQTARCSTALVADESTANDRITRTFNVRVRDVGVDSIYRPRGIIDSGSSITPQARVTNYSTGTQSFYAKFRVGNSYLDSQYVFNLSSGSSTTVSFNTWRADTCGTFTASCTLSLANDQVVGNNKKQNSCTVLKIYRDASTMRIVGPKGVVDSGTVLTPQAVVRNYGNTAETFPVIFTIGPDYTDTMQVTSLAPQDSQLVTFAYWTAVAPGTFAVRCSTAQPGDTSASNNWASDSVEVVASSYDVGVTRLIAPKGVVDSGAVFSPQAMVRNHGNTAASFPVIFRIGAAYADTMQISGLAPQDSQLVTFAYWHAGPGGVLTTRCSTALAIDTLASNDAATDSVQVIVRLYDVGAIRVIALPDTADSGNLYVPQAIVRNLGSEPMSFPVRMTIGAYSDTKQVNNLPAGDSWAVTFAVWTASGRGSAAAVCSTMALDDRDSTNDLALKTIFQRVRDVGAEMINVPTGNVTQGTVVSPSATLENFGNSSDNFPVVFHIGTFYSDIQYTNGLSVTFRPCTLAVMGSFTMKCSTAMSGDRIRSNDAVIDSIRVVSSGIDAGDLPGTPRAVTLSTSGSSVFSGSATIVYGLPKRTPVRLEVYDACGRPVQTLASGVGEPGYHTAVWHCTGADGRALPGGAYFVRLTTDGLTLTSKVVKLK